MLIDKIYIYYYTHGQFHEGGRKSHIANDNLDILCGLVWLCDVPT